MDKKPTTTSASHPTNPPQATPQPIPTHHESKPHQNQPKTHLQPTRPTTQSQKIKFKINQTPSTPTHRHTYTHHRQPKTSKNKTQATDQVKKKMKPKNLSSCASSRCVILLLTFPRRAAPRLASYCCASSEIRARDRALMGFVVREI